MGFFCWYKEWVNHKELTEAYLGDIRATLSLINEKMATIEEQLAAAETQAAALKDAAVALNVTMDAVLVIVADLKASQELPANVSAGLTRIQDLMTEAQSNLAEAGAEAESV